MERKQLSTWKGQKERGNVMTGRDLIIYILSNNLENEPVFKDGKFLGFKTLEEVAVEQSVGIETVRLWAVMGMLECVKISDEFILIPANYISPMEIVK